MGEDKLDCVVGEGWTLTTDLDVKPGYFDRQTRKMYTKEEALAKRFITNKELFNVVRVIKR